MQRQSIAIIGCGLIGQSWAALFIAHGYSVRAWDPLASVRDQFTGRIAHPLEQLGELATKARPRGDLAIVDNLADAVTGADLVQENAPENIALKQALFRDIETVAPAAIIASSTSSLTWADLSVTLANPAQLITAHPFNPPHLIPLVETFGIDETNLDAAEEIYRDLGRQPVRLKKCAVGHIANRLASALWREAVHIVAEGIAEVADVDAALVHGPGLRWSVVGAHMAYHLGGGQGGIEAYLDHLGPSQERRWSTLGSPSLSPETCRMLIDGIKREADGRDITTLEAERDGKLIRALKAREADNG